jgi:NAD(P)H-hydrate epimerase
MATQSSDFVFTRDQVRRVDAEAIERYGIPGIVLMENASRPLAQQALAMLDGSKHRRTAKVLIICGGGNNGGDGFAAARHLHNAGLDTTVVLMRPADSYRGDAATNLNICSAMALNLIEAAADPVAALQQLPEHDLVIDGLLGTGLTSDVRPPLDAVIDWINQQSAPVLAIDIPSGLDCDTGAPLGCAVRADATVTFVGIKAGFTQPGAAAYTGRVIVGDIGVPRQLIESLGEPASR